MSLKLINYFMANRIAIRTNTKASTKMYALITLVEGDGFEPSKAVPTDLQSAPFGHSGIPPYNIFTFDLHLTLYLLWS